MVRLMLVAAPAFVLLSAISISSTMQARSLRLAIAPLFLCFAIGLSRDVTSRLRVG
jgi:hypothetical protein